MHDLTCCTSMSASFGAGRLGPAPVLRPTGSSKGGIRACDQHGGRAAAQKRSDHELSLQCRQVVKQQTQFLHARK